MNPEYSNKPSLEILPATQADMGPIVDLEEAVSMQTYPNPEYGIMPEDIAAIGWGDERVAKYNDRYLNNPNASIWVAKEEGEVVGFAAASKTDDGSWIQKIYIATDHQGSGVGSKLLTQAESWLGTETEIKVGVASYEKDALAFYTKHGYVPTTMRPENQTTIPATGKVIHEILLVKHPVHPVSGSTAAS